MLTIHGLEVSSLNPIFCSTYLHILHLTPICSACLVNAILLSHSKVMPRRKKDLLLNKLQGHDMSKGKLSQIYGTITCNKMVDLLFSIQEVEHDFKNSVFSMHIIFTLL